MGDDEEGRAEEEQNYPEPPQYTVEKVVEQGSVDVDVGVGGEVGDDEDEEGRAEEEQNWDGARHDKKDEDEDDGGASEGNERIAHRHGDEGHSPDTTLM